MQTMRTLFKYAGYDLTPINETTILKNNNPSIEQSENQNLKIEEIQVSKSQEDIQQKIKEIKEKYPNKVFDLESALNFNKIEDIGTGAKYKYTKVSMNKFYTLKEIKNGNLNSENIQQLIDEFNIMIELKHQNILKTHCLYYDLKKNQVSILLDYYPINLEQAIKNKMLSRTQQISSICQIAEVMKYIHSCKIKHLNLKPSNICFSKDDGTILIDDFHNAQRYISDDQIEQKEDIYAFGSILYFIITEGKMPQNKCAPIGYPIFLSELIDVCLSNELEAEVTFESICEALEYENFDDDWQIQDTKNKIKKF